MTGKLTSKFQGSAHNWNSALGNLGTEGLRDIERFECAEHLRGTRRTSGETA